MQVNLFKNFTEEECVKCGVIYFIPSALNESLRKTKNSFYCPNGHAQSYTKSTADILKETLQTKERIINSLESDKLILQKDQEKVLESKNKKRKK